MVDSIFTITLKVFVRLIATLNILGKLRTTAREGIRNPPSLRHLYTPGVNNCRQMNSRGFCTYHTMKTGETSRDSTVKYFVSSK